LRILWAFFKRDLLIETGYRLSFTLQLLGIVPVILMFFFLSRLVNGVAPGPLSAYGGNYFPFVLIGIAVQNYLTVSISGFSSSIRESQLSGTLEAVLAAPVKLPVFLMGSTAYSFVFNSLRIFLYLLVGGFFFGAPFHWSRIIPVLATLLLIITSFAALGIVSASFIILFKRGNPINWGISVLSWLLGGVYYPVSILPEWLQNLASFIPMTHALELLRMSLIVDRGMDNIAGHLLILTIWTVIGLPLSFWCFAWALDRARMKGNLGHY
jgi:ABC-2 type transport system permease protein